MSWLFEISIGAASCPNILFDTTEIVMLRIFACVIFDNMPLSANIFPRRPISPASMINIIGVYLVEIYIILFSNRKTRTSLNTDKSGEHELILWLMTCQSSKFVAMGLVWFLAFALGKLWSWKKLNEQAGYCNLL